MNLRRRLLRGMLVVLGLLLAVAVASAVSEEPPRAARTRPEWLSRELYPFADHWADIDGNVVHYVDEGEGPVLLFFHGNPTWSFLYRRIIAGLRDSYRCVAVDYPGFGLSTAKPGYGFTPQEHASVIEQLVAQLELEDVTPMVQDWGGPIGLGWAGRNPERVRALVIGNTWAWPVTGDPAFERFSSLMGGPIGGFFIRYYNAFVNLLVPGGISRELSDAELQAYRGPFPTHDSREPTHVFPHEIIASHAYLAGVEANLPKLAGKPVAIVWGGKDQAFRDKERARFEQLFPQHRTVIFANARHFIQEDEPQGIVEAIRTLLAEPPKATPATR